MGILRLTIGIYIGMQIFSLNLAFFHCTILYIMVMLILLSIF